MNNEKDKQSLFGYPLSLLILNHLIYYLLIKEVHDTGASRTHNLDKNNETILKFSLKQLEEIKKSKAEGYLPKKADVSFLVYWFDPENEKESLIVLPEIFVNHKN